MPRLKPKPSISIIGAGRIGAALAFALETKNYAVVALVARRKQKADKVAKLLKRTPVGLAANNLDQLPASDLIIIATPDDAIAEMAARLAAKRMRPATVLHTSGALSSLELSCLADVGFETGSMHPLVSISQPEARTNAFLGSFFCVEGSPRAVRTAKKIVADLGGKSFSVQTEKKTLYHAAAVMASPHLVALFDLATEMLAACGLSSQDARKVLLPLVESTVKNLEASSAQKALTGTFARGDLATVRRHLKALSSGSPDDAAEVYRLLGLRSLKLAKKNGLDSRAVSRIKKLLSK